MNQDSQQKVSYSYSMKVEKDHLDDLDHVNNVVYLQWVNDISAKHWEKLSSDGLNQKYFWVVLRHELDYLSPAVLNDKLTLITWVGASSGVKSVRHVEIYKGKTLLLKAASTWCLIDAGTLKPTRIKSDILDRLNPET